MSELLPHDHQLFVTLENAFRGTSFLLYSKQWKDFEKKRSIDRLPGDEESVDRLIEAGRVIDLGVVNQRRHFTLKKKQ